MHAPRQRNIMYVHTVRRSIYETRRPEQPHSPIRRYKRRPQGPPSWTRYMEYWPFQGHATSTSMYTSTATSTNPRVSAAVTIMASTTLLRQEPSHCRIRYLTLALSSASTVPFWQSFPTVFDSPIFNLIWLTCFRLDSNHLFFDLILLNVFSIWFDSIAFRFD